MLSAINGWDITEWAVALAAFVTACGVIWTKVVRPVREFVQRLKAWMERVEQSLTWTEQQMRPNGGSSLTDKVDRLREDVSMLLSHDAERDRQGFRYGDTDSLNEED